MKDDLNYMGFKNIKEMAHGSTHLLTKQFKITSYQFGIFFDSVLAVECKGISLLNLNDCKMMGAPLRSIIKRHGPFKFVLRSHSSANSRLSYVITDDPSYPIDPTSYIENFTDTVKFCNAEYAIPFASNHCYLLPEIFTFNNTVQTPQKVQDYFLNNSIMQPKIRVMVSGDSWSSSAGFEIKNSDYFSNRDFHLRAYQEKKRYVLEKRMAVENSATLNMQDVERYYKKFFSAIPWFFRRKLKHHPVVYVLRAGARTWCVVVDIFLKMVYQIDPADLQRYPLQIHTGMFIFNQCLQLDLFSHLTISKRVTIYTTKQLKPQIDLFNRLYNLYEYELIPIRRWFCSRALETWCLRWREIILYAFILKDVVLHKKLNLKKHLRV